jgi:serine-type D-Ala-D-Ala carboxypeptidase (penicillin-binding protein 5/6)
MARAPLLAATALVIGVGALVPQTGAAATPYVIGGAALSMPGTVVHRLTAAPPLPATTATAFIVADATTGQILAARDAHGRLAPASTLKTLTALTALPRLSGAATVKGSWAAAGVDGTKVGINPGQTYTAKDLFTAMLVMSGNDAAVSIGDAIGGGSTAIARMNAEAAHLQARDTVAHTTNGLDAPGQTSSAYDLALMFRAGLSNSRFRYYVGIRSALFPLAHGKSYRIYTHDRLLNSYPGMIGGKNGYTIAAHASYVGAATRGRHTIIVAVMRDVPNFWPEVTSLLNWGFAADGHVTPVGRLVAPLK